MHREIFKTETDAAKYAKTQGYGFNASRFYKDEKTTCKCGETSVAVFWVDENMNFQEMLVVGICLSCGEEW